VEPDVRGDWNCVQLFQYSWLLGRPVTVIMETMKPWWSAGSWAALLSVLEWCLQTSEYAKVGSGLGREPAKGLTDIHSACALLTVQGLAMQPVHLPF
jgi:hypothetical protein